MIGGIVAGLNHGMHKMSNGEPEAKRKQIVKRAKAHKMVVKIGLMRIKKEDSQQTRTNAIYL